MPFAFLLTQSPPSHTVFENGVKKSHFETIVSQLVSGGFQNTVDFLFLSLVFLSRTARLEGYGCRFSLSAWCFLHLSKKKNFAILRP